MTTPSCCVQKERCQSAACAALVDHWAAYVSCRTDKQPNPHGQLKECAWQTDNVAGICEAVALRCKPETRSIVTSIIFRRKTLQQFSNKWKGNNLI